MKFLAPLLLSIAAAALAQEDPGFPAGVPPGEYPASLVPAAFVPEDSLARRLALIDIARAEVAVGASDFWHRLIPHVQLSATLGAREMLFPDPAGGLLLPKDSYRISLSIAPAEIFDGSRHALALLQLEEARTRHALLLGRQSQARLAVTRKRIALVQDLALAREQMELGRLLLEYYELLFRQGKTEFNTLTRSRLEAARMRANFLDLERRVRETGSTSP